MIDPQSLSIVVVVVWEKKTWLFSPEGSLILLFAFRLFHFLVDHVQPGGDHQCRDRKTQPQDDPLVVRHDDDGSAWCYGRCCVDVDPLVSRVRSKDLRGRT